MADLNDIDIKSILNMDQDEAIESLRQIRLSRRIPVRSKKITKSRKPTTVSVDSTTAAKLLKILGGENV